MNKIIRSEERFFLENETNSCNTWHLAGISEKSIQNKVKSSRGERGYTQYQK